MSELFDRAKAKWLEDQKLTYWSPAQANYAGVVVYGSPVLINCRWNVQQELVKDNEGRELTSVAKIHPATAVLRAGYVALGDYTTTPDPKTLETDVVYEVMMVKDHDGVHSSELLTFWV